MTNIYPFKQHLVEKVNNIFRYLDDFNINTEDVYPAELSLNKVNIAKKECSFLDLSVHINNGKLKY